MQIILYASFSKNLMALEIVSEPTLSLKRKAVRTSSCATVSFSFAFLFICTRIYRAFDFNFLFCKNSCFLLLFKYGLNHLSFTQSPFD